MIGKHSVTAWRPTGFSGLSLPAALAVATLAVAGCGESNAAFPNQSVRIVQPNPAGSASDVTIRKIAERMQAVLHKPVIVENHPGSGGVTATNLVAKAKPDGYTLIEGTLSTFATNKFMYKNLPYDPVADFKPIATISFAPSVLVISAKTPAKTVAEFIAYAKARPGGVKYGTLGVGSTPHLAAVEFVRRTGIKAIHVPYVSASEAFQDLVNGQTAFMIYPLTPLKPFVNAGSMRLLAATGTERTKTIPNVPTMSEAGVTGYVAGSWSAIFAPAKTPDSAIQPLYKAVAQAIEATRPSIEADGNQVLLKPPEETTRFVAAEIERMAPIVRAAVGPAR